MSFYRPLRPFFYKPVAILGVPLFYWKLTLGATILTAVILFVFWRQFYGLPVWFILSIGLGLILVSFFLWAFNTHKRGWLEHNLRFHLRELTGGQNLLSASAGRKKTVWLLDAENGNKTKRTAWNNPH